MIFPVLCPSARREHELSLAQRQRHAPNDPRRPGPTDKAQDDDDEQIRLRGTDLRRKRRAQGHDEIKAGDRHDQFADAHDHIVRAPAGVAGKSARQHPEGEGEGDADQSDGQGNLRAKEHARKNVPPLLVRAEQIDGMLVVTAEEMEVRGHQAEQLVFLPAHENRSGCTSAVAR